MSLRKTIIIFGGTFLVLLLTIFIILKRPYFVAFGAYNRLAISAYQEPSCHEQCFIKRRNYRAILINDHSRFKAEEKIKKALLSEEENLNFRKELVLLLSEKYSNDNLPSYVQDFVSDPKASWEVKQEILSYFQVSNFNLGADLEQVVLNSATSDEERRRAISALMGLEDDTYFPIFAEALSTSSSELLFRSAAIALSNISNKEKYFTESFITQLRSLLYLEKFPPRQKREVIYLLSDASKFSKTAENILRQASSDKSLDEYSRYFSARALDLPVADLSEEKWQQLTNY